MTVLAFIECDFARGPDHLLKVTTHRQLQGERAQNAEGHHQASSMSI